MSLFDKTEERSSLIAQEYEIAGKKIICQTCGNDTFHYRDAILDTAVASFFGMEWANKRAALLICTKCGKIEWYLEKPDLV
ncbi:MAG: DNA-binding protein [Bacteroidota bacterium]